MFYEIEKHKQIIPHRKVLVISLLQQQTLRNQITMDILIRLRHKNLTLFKEIKALYGNKLVQY